jgi:hypothetical protein
MRFLKIIGIIFLGLALSAGVACFVFSHRLPESTPGDAASALATKVEQAVNLKAFYQIPVISFGFRERNQHLWDKHRGLARVVYGKEKDSYEILFHLSNQKGIAFHKGQRLTGEAEAEALKEGYSRWANDSFWLNPITKLRDKGVTLSTPNEDPSSLIVAFSSGGVTPGDTYRFYLGEDGKPIAFEMWVSILPIKGARASWKDWQEVSGAWIASNHRFSFGLSVYLTDITAAKTAAELNNGVDPFARLFEAEGAKPVAPTSTPVEPPSSAPAETP